LLCKNLITDPQETDSNASLLFALLGQLHMYGHSWCWWNHVLYIRSYR